MDLPTIGQSRVVGVLSPKQEKYRTWLATPRSMRPEGLRTRADFSKRFEVDEDTLGLWECSQGWWDDVYAHARAIVGREMAEILEALVGRAKQGSVQAAKLCLQTLGVHSDKIDLHHEYEDDQLVLIVQAKRADPGTE